jgi:hypothetical protein
MQPAASSCPVLRLLHPGPVPAGLRVPAAVEPPRTPCYSRSMLHLLLAVILLLASGAWLRADSIVRLETVASGLAQPLLVTHAGDGTNRLFIVQKGGLVRVLQDGQLLVSPFLDLSGKVTTESEMGLLSLVFHPEFRQNGRLFVNYATEAGGPRRTVIAEYQVAVPNGPVDPSSERIVLTFSQPARNHNGGMMVFGPDGHLYIASGDGGGSNDTFGNGQNLGTLLGGILRIDVDRGDPYSVPPDNPLVDVEGARPELWAWGLRNPWRISFDRLTGQLFAGDVGQASWEEIDLIRRGGNFGWNRMEGTRCFPPGSQCDPAGLVLPIAEYGRDEGYSVTGGYVYRGRQETALWGAYIFGDFGSGRIWSLTAGPGEVWTRRMLLDTDLNLSSFGEDEQGEIYAVSLGGSVHRLVFGWRERFAQFADGPSPLGVLRSELILASGEDRPISGAIRFRDREGVSRPVEIGGTSVTELPFELAPREAAAFPTSGSAVPVFVGWTEVEADGRFEGTVLFRFEPADGGPPGEAGVGASETATTLTTRVVRRLVDQLDTGVAVANPNPFPVVIRARFVASGQLVAEAEFSLEPGTQQAVFSGEIAELGGDFAGTLQLEADAEVIATVLRTRAGLPLSSLPLGR